jgi:hypothetical protein
VELLAALFLSPIDVQGYWILLLFPLTLGISLVYRATRCDDIRTLPAPVLRLWGEILAAVFGLGIGLYFMVSWILG